jgi:hypothetical protein
MSYTLLAHEVTAWGMLAAFTVAKRDTQPAREAGPLLSVYVPACDPTIT